MATWTDLTAADPELAGVVRRRLEEPEVVLVGTLCRDGSPRISPVEPQFLDGELLLGMIWHSVKALDLVRDPRCVIHSIVNNRHGTGGDAKVHGRAVDVPEADVRGRYAAAVEARIDWRPPEPFHLFRVEIDRVAHSAVVGDEMVHRRWRADAN